MAAPSLPLLPPPTKAVLGRAGADKWQKCWGMWSGMEHTVCIAWQPHCLVGFWGVRPRFSFLEEELCCSHQAGLWQALCKSPAFKRVPSYSEVNTQ